MDDANIPQIATMLGSLGFAVWYAWHVTTHTLPNLHSQHAVEREAFWRAANEERRESRAEFKASLQEILTHCKDELHSIAEGAKR